MKTEPPNKQEMAGQEIAAQVNNPKLIFLQPMCDECKNEPHTRLWCEDDVWAGEDCEECGRELPESSRYVLLSTGFAKTVA
jgi:hypothetical protein